MTSSFSKIGILPNNQELQEEHEILRQSTYEEFKKCIHFNSWYSVDILRDIIYSYTSPIHALRYICVTSDGYLHRKLSQQLKNLVNIRKELKLAVDFPCYFITPEFGVSENHFILGAIFNKTLLIIDPTGLPRIANKEEIKRISKELDLDKCYYSTTPLQKDGEDNKLVSCGPLCLELMLHFIKTPSILNKFLKDQQEIEAKSAELKEGEDREFEEGDEKEWGVDLDDENIAVEIKDISITDLLPSTLSTLLDADYSDYRTNLETIRKNHFNKLQETISYYPHEDSIIRSYVSKDIANLSDKETIETKQFRHFHKNSLRKILNLKLATYDLLTHTSPMQPSSSILSAEKKVNTLSTSMTFLTSLTSPQKFDEKEKEVKAFSAANIKTINTGYQYYDNMIFKVWDSFVRSKGWKFYCGARGIQSTLFSGESEMNVNIAAGMVIKADGALYQQSDGCTVSLCERVDYIANSGGPNTNAITDSLSQALDQIALWSSADTNTPITKHLIIFPYHCSGNHWNLGNLQLEYKSGISFPLVKASMCVYEPLHPTNTIPPLVITSIESLLRHNGGGATLKFIFSDDTTSGFYFTQQQSPNDATSCGPISAQNGIHLINGEAPLITRGGQYPIGAEDLRRTQCQLVKNQRFYEMQATNEYIRLGNKILLLPDAFLVEKLMECKEKAIDKEKFNQALKNFANWQGEAPRGDFVTEINNNKIPFSQIPLDEKCSFFNFFIGENGQLKDHLLETLLSGVSCLVRKEVSPIPSPIEKNILSTEDTRLLDDCYDKESTLPDSQAGNVYQLKILMLCAFRAYRQAQEDKRHPNKKTGIHDFALGTEAKHFEKFDDLIVEYKNHSRVMQIKHARGKEKECTLTDFVTKPNARSKKEGPFSLAKYFKSWINIRRKILAKNPNLSEKQIEYILFTNRNLSKKEGLDDCFQDVVIRDDEFLFKEFNSASTKRIKDQNDLTEEQKEIYKKIKESIREHSAALFIDEIEINCDNHDDYVKESIESLSKKLTNDILGAISNEKINISFSGKGKGKENKNLLIGILSKENEQYRFSENFCQGENLKAYHQDLRNSLESDIIKQSTSGKSKKSAIIKSQNIPNLLRKITFECPKSLFEKHDAFVKHKSDTETAAESPELNETADGVVWEVTDREVAKWLVGMYGRSRFTVGEIQGAYPEHLQKMHDDVIKRMGEIFQESKLGKDDDTKDALIEEFLQVLRFKTGQPDEEKLGELIIKEMGKEFNIGGPEIYNAFQAHFLDWMKIRQGKAVTLANAEDFFIRNKARLTNLHLVGYGINCLKKIEENHKFFPFVDRVEFSKIKKFINSDPHHVLFVTGPKASGKTYAVTHSITTTIETNRWAFVDTECRLLKEALSMFKDKDFRLLAVECNLDFLKRELATFFEIINQAKEEGKLQKSKKQIIFICSEKDLEEIQLLLGTPRSLFSSDLVTIPPLTDQVVRDILARKNAMNQFLQIGGKQLALEQILSAPHIGVHQAMLRPGFLVEILKQSVAFNVELSEEKRDDLIKNKEDIFIGPTIESLMPFYHVHDLLLTNSIFNINSDAKKEDEITEILCHDESYSIIHIKLSNLKKLYRPDKHQEWKKLIEEYYSGYIADRDPFKSYHDKFILLTEINLYPTLDASLQDMLKKHRRYFMLNENTGTFVDVINLSANIEENKIKFELCQLRDHEKMPAAKNYGRSSLVTAYHDEDYKKLLTRHPFGQKRVIVSSYGTGKSKLLTELDKSFKNALLTHSYSWISFIALKKLSDKDNLLPLASLIKKYNNLQNLYRYEEFCLEYDIINNNVLFLLDGWDETKESQRLSCNSILNKLFSYANIIVTSRPSDESTIPVNAIEHLRLEPFNSDQINKFISLYFDDSEIDFRHKAHKIVNEYKNEERLNLLGKPLLCKITCDIIKSGTSAFDGKKLFISTLFQKLIESNLRKFHHVHNKIPINRLLAERIYHLSHLELSRMSHLALSKIFNIKNNIESNPILDDDLSCIALVKINKDNLSRNISDYDFDHQTIAEYFAAIQILRNRMNHQEDGFNLIKENLYNLRYLVVWQFISSIVTAGDVMIPNATGLCLDFLKVWYKAPKDLVGRIQSSLLNSCLLNSDFNHIKNSIIQSNLSSKEKEQYLKFFERHRNIKNIFDQSEEKTEEYNRVEKILPPEIIDKDDEEIERTAQYSRGILKREHYATTKWIKNYEKGLSDEKLCDSINQYAQDLLTFFEKQKGNNLTEKIENLYKFNFLIKKLNKEKDVKLIEKATDVLLRYFLAPQSMNSAAYQPAYEGICGLVDAGLLLLDQGLSEKLATNFNQKVIVCDLIKRLCHAGLINDSMIKKLCVYNRDSREEFWDLNAGIPAILYLKKYLNDDIVNYLVDNILKRNYGDFEIEKTYEVLLRLSKLRYTKPEHIALFVKLLAAIYNPAMSYKSQYIQFRNNIIVCFSRENLISSIWNEYCTFAGSFDKSSCIKKFICLELLFDIAVRYDLAIMMVGNELRWNSDLIAPLKIPLNKLEEKFILYNFSLNRNKLISKKKFDTDRENLFDDFYNYLKSIDEFYCGKQYNVENIPKVELILAALEDNQYKFEAEIKQCQLEEMDRKKIFFTLINKLKGDLAYKYYDF